MKNVGHWWVSHHGELLVLIVALKDLECMIKLNRMSHGSVTSSIHCYREDAMRIKKKVQVENVIKLNFFESELLCFVCEEENVENVLLLPM